MTVRNLTLILVPAIANLAAADPSFTEIVIDAGFHVDQPILTATLHEDGRRNVVLAGRDDEHRQNLAVYSVDINGEPTARLVYRMNPGTNLIAYDVGRIGDRDALFFVEPGRVSRLDLEAEELVEVVKIQTIYAQPRAGEIVPVDFVRDINLDDRDDLIVPDTAGYRVRLQRDDGTLGDEILLQQSTSMTVSGDFVSFENRPLFSGDMNADNLADVGVWRGNSLRVYSQLADFRFSGQPEIVTLGLGLPTESEMRAMEAGRGAVDQRGLTEKRIWSIQDLNNDRVPDILTESTLFNGVFDRRTDFRLHLGRRSGGQVEYLETEDALLASEGLQFGLLTPDIDGDGNKDLLVRELRMTFGRVIRALLSGKVTLQLHFYRMTGDRYAKEPNYITSTSVRFSVTSGQVDIPAIQVADFDADGSQDLMMQSAPNQLSFYRGVATDSLFTTEAVEMSLALPRNGDLVATADINDDGRSDLIVRYNAADGDGASRTVRLLLATP